MKNLSYAKRVLTHYMKLVMFSSGRFWDEDNEAEINGIVEDIEDYINERIAEAVKEIKESLNEKV